MNAPLSAVLVMLLITGGWLLGRRRSRPFLRSTDTGAVVALNRAQIERLRERTPDGPVAVAPVAGDDQPSSAASAPQELLNDGASTPPPAPLPIQPRLRRARLRQLHAWLRGSREQRLAVMAVASCSAGRDLLPLLRRGLRDPDPAVMAAAAAVIQRFRGRSSPAPSPRPPLPRRR